MAIFSILNKYNNVGLLLMRIGLGVMMIVHGLPKLMGGIDKWEKVGSAMSHVGISFYPAAWGLSAALAESVGGVLIFLGLAFRPACIFLLFTMIIAAAMHLASGDGLLGASHPIELGFVFLGLLFVGPGKYSVDKK